MKFEAFSKELANKRRTVADLARYIETRTDTNPNYVLLLGAGCSISSGIRSASELSNLWRVEVCSALAGDEVTGRMNEQDMRDYLKREHYGWYDPAREYSSLFEKRYDLQRQRRMFVETEVAGKIPSIGYAYLTSLVCQNYFSTLFTTNFDDLINEAFYLYSDQRPILCAHDSSIDSITVTSRRPKVIKLHGDYLFDDLKATTRETESLEQNMKQKFLEFCKEYGLVVIGYSGGDRSIMDTIGSLLKNESYFKAGIYWCLKKGADVPEELRKLLWRERVYFVEIDGFDELLADLYQKFNKGDTLPVSAISMTRRPENVVDRLLRNETAFPRTTPTLQLAYEKLKRHSKRAELANLIIRPDSEDSRTQFGTSDLSDDELILLTEIRALVSDRQYDKAIEKSNTTLSKDLPNGFKTRLLKLAIQAYRSKGQIDEALMLANKLIEMNGMHASSFLLKASLIGNRSEKLKCLEQAENRDPYSVSAHYELAKFYKADAETCYGDRRSAHLSNAMKYVDKGIVLDPSWQNPCWTLKYSLIDLESRCNNDKKDKQKKIIDPLVLQRPYSNVALDLRIRSLDPKNEIDAADAILKDIERGEEMADVDSQGIFAALRITILAKINNLTSLRVEIDRVRRMQDFNSNPDAVYAVAINLRTKFGCESEAAEMLETCIKADFDGSIFALLFDAYCETGEISKAQELLEKWKNEIPERVRLKRTEQLMTASKRFDEALEALEKRAKLTGECIDTSRLYLLIKAGKYREAEGLARSILEPIIFSPEAVAELVNFEIAREGNGRKVDSDRLKSVIEYDSSAQTRAAVFGVLQKKTEMIAAIREAISDDLTFRFAAREWPAFARYQNDPDFEKALDMSDTSALAG